MKILEQFIPKQGGKLNVANPYSAYTLIELVMVVVIIGILAINAIPKLLNVTSLIGNTYYKDVLASIRYAQKIAVGMGCDVQVNYSINSITLNTRASCTTGSFTQNITDPAFGGSTFIRTAPNGTTISSVSFPIYFDSLGRAKNSASNNISNASITVGATTINIIGETGYTYEP
jgi:MSHA pilin protein MshC